MENFKVLKPIKHSMKIYIIPGQSKGLFDLQADILALIFNYLTIQDLLNISITSRHSRTLLNPLTSRGYEIWKSGFDGKRDLQSKIDLLSLIFKNDLSKIPKSELWERYRLWLGFPEPTEINLDDRVFLYRYFNRQCSCCDYDLVFKIWEWCGMSFCKECFQNGTTLGYKPYPQSISINNLFYTRAGVQKAFVGFGKAMKRSEADLNMRLAREEGIRRLLRQTYLLNHLLMNIPTSCKTTLKKCPSYLKALDGSVDSKLDLQLLVVEVTKDLELLTLQKYALDLKLKLLAAKPRNILDDEILKTLAFNNACGSLSGFVSEKVLSAILGTVVDEVIDRRRKVGLPGIPLINLV
jgi:hypothetical protein